MEYKVLVIEDRDDDMACVKKSLPANCKMIPTNPEFTRICGNGLRGETVLNNGETAILQNELKRLLEKHHEELVAIVCDLCLGNEKDGGIEVIRWIRDTQWNGLDLPEDYLKNIPIIVFSSTTSGAGRHTEALRTGATSLVVKKRDVLTNKNKIDDNLQSTLKSQIQYFQYVCKHNDNWKDYYVALSFTGRNHDIQHREFVEFVANQLYIEYRKKRVFFDQDKLIEGVTPSYGQKEFSELYMHKCKYIIVFLSSNYNTKDSPWTQQEWYGIHEYYKIARKNVIFVSLEDSATKEIVSNNLGLGEIICIPASKAREDYYSLINGENKELENEINRLISHHSDITVFNNKYIKKFQEKCATIANSVVTPIVNHISLVESGKK